MSGDFAMLMEHLRAGAGEVELDLPPPQSSGDPATASRHARARQVAIRRGDRVARLYKLVDGRRVSSNGVDPRPSLSTSVTDTECRALLGAGAKWVGPSMYTPVQRRHVERLRVRSFRCIKEVEFPLTPLHALIGPNDSGKSTLLEALAMILGTYTDPDVQIRIISNGRALTRDRMGPVEHDPGVESLNMPREVSSSLANLVWPVRVLRLDPDAMRRPTNLIPQSSLLEYSVTGEGLAAVYDAFLSRRLDVFLEISKRFALLFPTARAIQLTNPSDTTKALGVELVDGQSVGPQHLSEGMLYWLAFAALPYLRPTPLILVEEPENGLHPSRIGDVMGVLREISKTSQVIVATHHPLVINELQPDEVTLITRTAERGTIATPLSRTKNFEQRSKVYALGELWLNYADGEFESDLVADATLPSVAG